MRLEVRTVNKDIMICGVGGQGTVLASKVLAAAAMKCGETVHSAETIGMAQRGGSVISHVRIGEAYSPLIPFGSADMILAFEPAEAVRNLIYLKKDGIVIVNSVPTKPTTETLQDTGYDGTQMIEYLQKKCRCLVIDAEEMCRPFGSSRYFNIIILGVAAATNTLGIEKDVLLEEIKRRVPEKYVDINVEAFLAGYRKGSEL